MSLPLKFLGGASLPSNSPIISDLNWLGSNSDHLLREVIRIANRASIRGEEFDILAETDNAAAKFGVDVKAFRRLVVSIIFIFRNATKYSINGSSLRNDLIALNLKPEYADIFSVTWESIGPTLVQFASSVATVPDSLVDAQWRFGVTVSSNDVERVGATYLQLKLSTCGEDGVKDQYLQLTVQQFYDLLAELEKAKSYVDCLASV